MRVEFSVATAEAGDLTTQEGAGAGTEDEPDAKGKLREWEEKLKGRSHAEPPYFQKWADDFQTRVPHESTRKRYASSIKKLKKKLTGIRLSDISAE